MAATPRHVFIEEALAHRAYEDTALPLGLGQTISQPYIVARMIELLKAGRAGLGGVQQQRGLGGVLPERRDQRGEGDHVLPHALREM